MDPLQEKRTVVFEEHAQHLSNSEDNLAVRYINEKLLSHPFSPLLSSLGLT
jgi:hypothetical protein